MADSIKCKAWVTVIAQIAGEPIEAILAGCESVGKDNCKVLMPRLGSIRETG